MGSLVTGASRGLGRALARSLARRGDRVALVARDGAALERVVREIREEGGEAFAIARDIGEKDDIHAIAALASEALGSVDLVIHNASTLGPSPLRLLGDTDCEDLERALAVNVVGPFRLTKSLLGARVLRASGTFVHISSDAAVAAYPEWGAYGASKAAFDHLARTWAAELEGTGVRFVTLDPGEMDTAMHREALPLADPSLLARPEDVAQAIVSILSHPELASGSRIEVSSWRPS